jgi:dihydrofolate synthase/folylpolyglutamate synthase
VSFDHREYLGNTLRSIAREKAGIIKRDVACVTGSREREVLETLKSTARKRGARLFEASRVATLRVRENGKHRTTVTIRSPKVSIKNVPLGLEGLHQAENARLAVASLDILLRDKHFAFGRIRNASIARGLRRVKENIGIHGRLEKFGRHGRYTLDVAHNPAGVDTVVRALGNRQKIRYVIVFGVMKDKEYTPMLQGLVKIAEIFIAVAPSMSRALKVSVLYRRMKMLGVPAERAVTIRDGITKADVLAGPKGKVLITGSHFVVAEALGFLLRKRT